MKKKLYLTLLGCIIMTLFLSACGEKSSKINLIITNKSSQTITNVAIQRVKQTDVMGSNLKPKENCYFDMGVQKNCTYKVTFEDKNKNATSSDNFTSDFTLNKNRIVNINISQGNKGKWSIVLAK